MSSCKSEVIYFPFNMLNMVLEIEGEVHYPDMNITITSIVDTGKEVEFFSSFAKNLERSRQKDLYDAWVKHSCSYHGSSEDYCR